jgi:transposase
MASVDGVGKGVNKCRAEPPDDIALEVRLALALTDEISELDERIALLVKDRDPNGIITSAPAIGTITSAVILGRLGDLTRFASLAAARSSHLPGVAAAQPCLLS